MKSQESLNQTTFQLMLNKIKPVLLVVFLFSFCSNLTMLITPLYSLQVLDRVIGSQNVNTLLMLSLIIGFVYFIYSMIQVVRSFVLIKLAEWMDKNISPILFSHSVSACAISPNLSAGQALRDFNTVKNFVTSAGINTLFDIPWVFAYITAIFMIHRWLGYVTVIGGVIIILFGLFNAVATTRSLGESTEFFNKAISNAEIATRNAETVEGMGMMKDVSNNWLNFQKQALEKQMIASNRNTIIANTSRYIRNLLQMCITGFGAYAVISSYGQEMTTGGMIASSILFGRAMAPFDSFIDLWKNITGAMKAYKRINDSFKNPPVARNENMSFLDISGNLSVENVFFAHPPRQSSNPLIQNKPREILKDISFALKAGETLAIVGKSGSGKTTLSKILVGVWRPTSGHARINGIDTYSWNREDFGKHVGYMPQGVELFNGTVKQNIARMTSDIDVEKVQEAAKLAGAHEFILSLFNGYDTDIGSFGDNLSGGQKQKIALARAFYGNPKFVLLDEPNANLDRDGDKALGQAINKAKELGITVVLISHRQSVLEHADKMLVIEKGEVQHFDKTEIVIKKLLASNA
ncbi:MAG: type I secretion system permease/ATPase [Rickettsiales bacterium]